VSTRELVEVTDPLGPGLDVEPGQAGPPVVVRARAGIGFAGLDRGFVVDSDDGTGRSLRAFVALPVSSWRGCRVEVRWEGVVRDGRGPILLGGIEGGPHPTAEVVGTVLGARVVGLGSPQEAARLALEARRRYRERRAARRVIGGRAWELPGDDLQASRFTTPHARPSYALGRLPPRYVRALERVLDPDERVLYAVERPFDSTPGGWRRRGRADRRAAILVLTDREVAWIVDHVDPDRYLSDWGVDALCVPVERLQRATASISGGRAVVRLETPAGSSNHGFPAELSEEARVFAELAARFTPSSGATLPRRSYPDADDGIDWTRMDAFGESEAVRALAAAATDRPVSVVPSPARPGHRQTTAWVLGPDGVAIVGRGPAQCVPLADVHAVGLVLSPLEGRTELLGTQRRRLDVPAPYVDVAAAFTRAVRRRMASMPGAPRR
jgi:hypothetical protein